VFSYRAARNVGGIALGLGAAVIIVAASWRAPEVVAYRLTTRPLVQTVVATGRVIGVSRAQVGSEIVGVVMERRVVEGDRVAAGDVLATLRADDLAARVREAEAAIVQLETSTRPQSQVALREAEVRLEQARRETKRRRDLFARQLLAAEAVEQAEQTETLARAAAERAELAAAALARGGSDETVLRERLAAARADSAKTSVRAEVAGVVLTRGAEPGDVVQPGRVLFEIASDGATELLVPVDEANLATLALGQTARCVADAYPGEVFAARVTLIAPRIDPRRGTVDVRLEVDPVPSYLRQDMTVSVNIETGRREQALAVPNDALFAVGGENATAFVVRDDRVAAVNVRLGLTGAGLTEVVSGLAGGDIVLAEPAAASYVGRRVRTIEQPVPYTGSP
jgi:HlyD family secretion protein